MEQLLTLLARALQVLIIGEKASDLILADYYRKEKKPAGSRL
jgi:hypothetical protein